MNDPYVVLGISRDATDDEVKSAYRALAKKYHPDNFASSPELAEVANEKMREVNEAYDAVVRERKNGGASSSSHTSHSSYTSSSSSSQSQSSYSSASSSSSNAGGNPFGGNAGAKPGSRPRYTNQYSTTTDFPDVRRLIMNNRFDDANAVLDGVTPDRRNAEWNFLKGAVLYRRGWLEQANVHLTAAVNMEPDNAEFRAAYNQCTNMRSGSKGGYRMGKEGGGCSPCNACCSLLCADQCCECMGGDLISCC